jgi:hypothetical protein
VSCRPDRIKIEVQSNYPSPTEEAQEAEQQIFRSVLQLGYQMLGLYFRLERILEVSIPVSKQGRVNVAMSVNVTSYLKTISRRRTASLS